MISYSWKWRFCTEEINGADFRIYIRVRRMSDGEEGNHGSSAVFGGSLPLSLSHQYSPYHMGLFPFLLDTKPPHFIFGPSLSLYAPFHSLLMFPSKPYLYLIYQWSIGVKCQLGFLCLYTYICIERKLVIVYFFFFPYTFYLFINVAIIKLSRKIPT